MLPKLYRITQPRKMWQVVFTEPNGKRRRRHFSKKEAAEKYHKAILTQAKIAGTSGLVMDSEARAEYFAAKRALEGVPLMTAVRHYLKHRPIGAAATPLPEALGQFISEKKRLGRAERTVAALRNTLEQFLAETEARRCCDFTREAVTKYLDSLDVEPGTIKNHRRRLSAFGSWMVRRQIIPDNPVRHIEPPTVDLRPPRVLTPAQASLVMAKAADYVDGTFATTFAIALFAGLRRGEIERLSWDAVHLDGEPVIRVSLGKLRGRRSVRVVPICDALLSWLKWGRARGHPLVKMSSNSAKIRKAVTWQTDITRHSWISYRLALVKDEAQVAREAGNSPDMIYRHYFQLVSEKEAAKYFAIFAP
ncbi:integrase [Ereboglobus sp. PH5-10]|nr:integrase [Ereboglobus sp. PH5-10]